MGTLPEAFKYLTSQQAILKRYYEADAYVLQSFLLEKNVTRYLVLASKLSFDIPLVSALEAKHHEATTVHGLMPEDSEQEHEVVVEEPAAPAK